MPLTCPGAHPHIQALCETCGRVGYDRHITRQAAPGPYNTIVESRHTYCPNCCPVHNPPADVDG